MTILLGVVVAVYGVRQSARGSSETLLQMLHSDGRFSALTAALERADMTALVRDHGPFTLFAPTNAALAAYDLSQLTPTQLRQLLLHHMLPGAYDRSTLAGQTALRTALGESVRVGGGAQTVLDGRTYLNGDPLRASNGMIYAVDTLLLPPVSYLTLTSQTAAVATPSGNQNGVQPTMIPFSEASFNLSILAAHEALRQLGGVLDGHHSDPLNDCPAYLDQFFRLANVPFHTDVPRSFLPQVERYETSINHVLRSNEPYVLYCMEGGVFSEFNFGLARNGIGEAAAMLEPLFLHASAPAGAE